MSLEVSVIIPTYNSAALLPEAIDSALGQTLPPREVIVVDDGSTDETGRVLGRFGDRIVAVSQANAGPAAARNRGIAAARGDLIALLDADDVWLPEKLEKQVACLRDHPRAALVHSQVYYWDPKTGERSVQRERGRGEYVGDCYRRLFLRQCVIPSSAILRRSCVEEVGGFDERIRRASAEDYDLWLRLARRHEFACVDEPLVLYRQHPSSSTKRQSLAIIDDNLYVLRKALRDDPGLVRALGRSAVDARFFEFLFEAGYRHHDEGRPLAARSYLLEALGRRPASLHTWALYLASFLPSRWVEGLRRWKATLPHPGRRGPEPALPGLDGDG